MRCPVQRLTAHPGEGRDRGRRRVGSVALGVPDYLSLSFGELSQRFPENGNLDASCAALAPDPMKD